MTTPTPDNGGPAFPSTKQEDNGRGYGDLHEVHYPGMSLRDYFASKALAGICAHPDTWGDGIPEIARTAYEIADAMLAARNQTTT